MDSAEVSETEMDLAKILASGSPNGHRVELLERSDGSFVIRCDGTKQAVYAVGACNLESCIKSYLAFLQSL